MKASEIEWAINEARDRVAAGAVGSVGTADRLALALLHLHGILTAPLPEELAAIDARAEAATPGPWERELDRNDQENIRSGDEWIALLPHQCVTSVETMRARDAAFIAHARADIPRLLTGIRAQAATIRERDAEVARLAGFVRDCRDNWDCDPDAHRYGTTCRSCKARDVLAAGGEP